MDRPQLFVDTPARLAECADDVGRSARVALDTESNGFHAYFEKVCLLQIATAGADWAVDTLALRPDPLLPLLADPARECILHAAEYDVLCMKREYGLSFGRIFDTHAAAKTLGIEKVGLHDLLADQLGVRIEVDEQRSDWGRRPLSAEQLEYAFADVRHLLPMREKLGEQLAGRGLFALPVVPELVVGPMRHANRVDDRIAKALPRGELDVDLATGRDGDEHRLVEREVLPDVR